MRKIVVGICITLMVIFIINKCSNKEEILIQEHSTLIEKQIKNVSKLVVTEGNFSEVFSYKNSKAVFGDLIEVEKKALVVVNAEVTVAYDLSKIEFNLDEENKTLTITKLPEQEIKIFPELEYYDVQADFLNPFKAEDYNAINKKVKQQITKKINASNLKSNAENRLVSELSKFYILTNSLGWTLQYNQKVIDKVEDLKL
ncbi:hypothetical protein FHS04_002098 [Mesoflavibacter sabulilitoris]|uniref:DUF4230 domain-containing protein n=1 Tax=Mesoflavibacter zeaxanthinifaciens subsp. sabulilitoris TaxID=1520893 RepID=A0A2T1NM39_9FLAO|nr:DUF4230 domain-containing protein [Mesoflavibacter zeaxanthinifaciens]MBB3124575.1 hypothetical protein [Mesoflavibacter zeaxanthinifaciens subsp. sabulilitoris]PSG93941.1 hypothetical protein C7H61_01845 [Mesoflavibacter zeaxanthinifaciens subsp. sabulilitoris]